MVSHVSTTASVLYWMGAALIVLSAFVPDEFHEFRPNKYTFSCLGLALGMLAAYLSSDRLFLLATSLLFSYSTHLRSRSLRGQY